MAPSVVLRSRNLISRIASNLFFPPHLPSLLPSARHFASSFGLHSSTFPSESHSTFPSESHSETNLNPTAVYRALSQAEDSLETLSREQRDTLDAIFRSFAKSTWISSQYLSYIPASFFQTAATQFRRFLLNRCNPHVFHKLSSLGPSPEADCFIFPIFIDFCLDEFPNKISSYKPLMESTNMTEPHTWFPFARAMKRKIFYHCGPTNSGKTYSALQSFMCAKKGVYCSPLRLLAMEVFDKVNRLGVYCSLSTGQEREVVPFSNHVACTIEMVSTDEFYDVAVIDEIQMLADSTRGYSWTKAFLGLMATELHLCGDLSVLNIIRNICKKTGDELHVQQYDRFKLLVVEEKTLLGDLKNVQSGDCILAFSRREIFEVKLAIEKLTEHKCCVIYGALPPETRRQQANLFNDQDTEYDVLVASDAVGMGLNLNIRRVAFYSMSKYNGEKMVLVSASQVKQIAGRAGRRGSPYPHGLVTTFNLDDLDYLIKCLKQPFAEVTKIDIFPVFKQIELYAAQFSGISFFRLQNNFEKICRLNGSYFLCHYQNVKKLAHMLERVKDLSLEEQYNFCSAPVNVGDPNAMLHLLHFAEHYSKHRLVDISVVLPNCSARNDQELLDLETKYAVCSMYVSLSYHFKKETFPQVQKAKKMAADIAVLLGKSLADTYWRTESRSQGKAKK